MHSIRGFRACLSPSRRGNWNSPGGIVPEFLFAAFICSGEDSSRVVILLPCQVWWLEVWSCEITAKGAEGHVHVL